MDKNNLKNTTKTAYSFTDCKFPYQVLQMGEAQATKNYFFSPHGWFSKGNAL